MIQAKPFLKWAGGKRQLLDTLDKKLPKEIRETKEIDLYVEPFIGGGAFFFYLLSNYKVERSIINDISPELMITYSVIKESPEELIKALKRIEIEYLSFKKEEKKEYYYQLRKTFNELNINFHTPDKKNWVKKASLLIVLNKLCFNGLFRQNSKGEFNVPMGKYKNPTILDEENIRRVSASLHNTEIFCGSYKDIKIPKTKQALVYLDPPYRPLSKTSSFTKYVKEDFNDNDQRKLARYFKELDKNGVNILLSNSDTGDGFFEELYKGFKIEKVMVKRYINANGKKRGDINELLISNI